MSVQTTPELCQSTIDTLQDLIRINVDSEEGHREASEQVNDRNVATLFRSIANHRRGNARMLQRFVRFNQESPAVEGSYAAALHRQWLDFRAIISGGNSKVILTEALRGENQLKKVYLEALREAAGSPALPTLQQQYESILKDNDRVKYLVETDQD